MNGEEPRIDSFLDDQGRLALSAEHAPGDAIIRCAYPWEGNRVLFLNGPYIDPIDPLPGVEIRFRLFCGRKAVSETQSFTFPGEPLRVLPPTTTIPQTQNRDFMAYAWQDRHRDAIRTVQELKPNLIFIGDSITHFFGGLPLDPHPLAYQRMAPDLWDASFGKWNPVNLGFGNDCIENALWRVTHGELDAAPHDALCVILIGTNNMRLNTNEEIVEGISLLCREVLNKVPSGNILLQGFYPRDTRTERAVQINGLLSRLNLPGVSFITPGEAIAGEGYFPKPGCTHDGIHPTGEGYALVAARLAEDIKRLFGE